MNALGDWVLIVLDERTDNPLCTFEQDLNAFGREIPLGESAGLIECYNIDAVSRLQHVG